MEQRGFVRELHPVTRRTSVLLITRWYGGDSNGVGILTQTLAQALRADDSRCVVIELVPDGIFPRRRPGRYGETVWSVCLRPRPIRKTFRGVLAYSVRSFLCKRLVRTLVRAHRLNIAHFHYASPSYEIIASALRTMGVPWIVTFHGSDLRVDIQNPSCKAVMRSLVVEARAVSAVSGALRDVAITAFPEVTPKTFVVHNSVSAGVLDAAKRVGTAGLNAPVVLFLGNLIKRKGVDILLRAWTQLVQSGQAPPPWSLVIAGGGPEMQALTQLAEQGVEAGRISFIGPVARDDIAALVSRASIMVIPSRSEPFGLVAVEGLAFGRSVIASDTGGLREIVNDDVTGVLVRPDDTAALAAALASLIADPDRRCRLASAAQKHVTEAFSPVTMAHAYGSLYRSQSGIDSGASGIPDENSKQVAANPISY